MKTLTIRERQQKWYNFNQSKTRRILLIAIGIILSLYYFPIITFTPSYLILVVVAIALTSLIISVKYYDKDYSVLLAFLALICFAVINVLVFLFLCMIITLLVFLVTYSFLERRRIKKIEIYANKIDISGARGYKPKTIITIKEDE